MKRRNILCIGMLLLSVVLLCACGKKDEGNKIESSSSQDEIVTENQLETETTSEESEESQQDNSQESETLEPQESETPEPQESEAPEPQESETSEPQESETPEPQESETLEPQESETPEPQESETPEPEESEQESQIPETVVITVLDKRSAYSDGEWISDMTYEYDEYGRLKKSHTETTYEKTSVLYLYDSEGRVVQEEGMGVSDWPNVSRAIYEYGDNIVTKKYYTINNVMEYYEVWEYNANGQEVRYTYYYANGDIWQQCIYEYDGEGKLIKEVDAEYPANGQRYEYDINGELIKIIYYNSSGEYAYSTYEYNEVGNLIRETFCTNRNQTEETTVIEYEYKDISVVKQ